MNAVLQFGFYYNLDTNLELCEWLLQRHPPDDQQLSICKTLRVPKHLWSFYLFAKERIRRTFCVYYNSHNYSIVPKIWIAERDFIDTTTDSSPFSKMTLSGEELFFIHHCRGIDTYRKLCFCVRFPVLSLQTLCVNQILEKEVDPASRVWLSAPPATRAWLSVLPATRARLSALAATRSRLSTLPAPLLSQLERERPLPPLGPPPRYDRRRMRDRFLEACRPLDDLFAERDSRVFCREFVVWFQNDPLVRRSFRRTEDEVVHFVFFGLENLQSRFNVCLKCMKWRLYRAEKNLIWQRRHYRLETWTALDVHGLLQNQLFWCADCLRVPLFQILDADGFKKEYGDEVQDRQTLLKVEEFL